MKTKVGCVQCPNCLDLIYSRAHHDFRHCSCGDTFVDGGFDYMRCGGKNIDKIKVVNKFVPVSRQELYDDWNKRINKYGRIPCQVKTKKR